MPILDLLSPQHVLANVAAADKAQLLEQLAAMLAGSSAEQRLIGEALNSRERLGSTGTCSCSPSLPKCFPIAD
ncbi:MAG: hypothetical protein IPH43_15320 [Xanthomonadales bacterium]|nr:hypothetical protein [Xanthomonadales bacterium]